MGRKSNYDKKKEEFMKLFAEHRAQFLYYFALTHNIEEAIQNMRQEEGEEGEQEEE